MHIEITAKDMAIIESHIKLGFKHEFPKKEFTVSGTRKLYCSYLFFTDSVNEIKDKHETVFFTCR